MEATRRLLLRQRWGFLAPWCYERLHVEEKAWDAPQRHLLVRLPPPFEQEDEATFRLKFRKFRKALRYWLLWVTSTNQRSSFSYDNFVEWILGKKERKLTKKTFQFATCSF